jgi:hypothetical protein
MKYSVETSLGVTNSHKDWFRHSKVDKEDIEADTQHGDLMSLLPFSQRKEIRLRNMNNLF